MDRRPGSGNWGQGEQSGRGRSSQGRSSGGRDGSQHRSQQGPQRGQRSAAAAVPLPISARAGSGSGNSGHMQSLGSMPGRSPSGSGTFGSLTSQDSVAGSPGMVSLGTGRGRGRGGAPQSSSGSQGRGGVIARLDRHMAQQPQQHASSAQRDGQSAAPAQSAWGRPSAVPGTSAASAAQARGQATAAPQGPAGGPSSGRSDQGTQPMVRVEAEAAGAVSTEQRSSSVLAAPAGRPVTSQPSTAEAAQPSSNDPGSGQQPSPLGEASLADQPPSLGRDPEGTEAGDSGGSGKKGRAKKKSKGSSGRLQSEGEGTGSDHTGPSPSPPPQADSRFVDPDRGGNGSPGHEQPDPNAGGLSGQWHGNQAAQQPHSTAQHTEGRYGRGRGRVSHDQRSGRRGYSPADAGRLAPSPSQLASGSPSRAPPAQFGPSGGWQGQGGRGTARFGMQRQQPQQDVGPSTPRQQPRTPERKMQFQPPRSPPPAQRHQPYQQGQMHGWQPGLYPAAMYQGQAQMLTPPQQQAYMAQMAQMARSGMPVPGMWGAGMPPAAPGMYFPADAAAYADPAFRPAMDAALLQQQMMAAQLVPAQVQVGASGAVPHPAQHAGLYAARPAAYAQYAQPTAVAANQHPQTGRSPPGYSGSPQQPHRTVSADTSPGHPSSTRQPHTADGAVAGMDHGVHAQQHPAQHTQHSAPVRMALPGHVQHVEQRLRDRATSAQLSSAAQASTSATAPSAGIPSLAFRPGLQAGLPGSSEPMIQFGDLAPEDLEDLETHVPVVTIASPAAMVQPLQAHSSPAPSSGGSHPLPALAHQGAPAQHAQHPQHQQAASQHAQHPQHQQAASQQRPQPPGPTHQQLAGAAPTVPGSAALQSPTSLAPSRGPQADAAAAQALSSAQQAKPAWIRAPVHPLAASAAATIAAGAPSLSTAMSGPGGPSSRSSSGAAPAPASASAPVRSWQPATQHTPTLLTPATAADSLGPDEEASNADLASPTESCPPPTAAPAQGPRQPPSAWQKPPSLQGMPPVRPHTGPVSAQPSAAEHSTQQAQQAQRPPQPASPTPSATSASSRGSARQAVQTIVLSPRAPQRPPAVHAAGGPHPASASAPAKGSAKASTDSALSAAGTGSAVYGEPGTSKPAPQHGASRAGPGNPAQPPATAASSSRASQGKPSAPSTAPAHPQHTERAASTASSTSTAASSAAEPHQAPEPVPQQPLPKWGQLPSFKDRLGSQAQSQPLAQRQGQAPSQAAGRGQSSQARPRSAFANGPAAVPSARPAVPASRPVVPGSTQVAAPHAQQQQHRPAAQPEQKPSHTREQPASGSTAAQHAAAPVGQHSGQAGDAPASAQQAQHAERAPAVAAHQAGAYAQASQHGTPRPASPMQHWPQQQPERQPHSQQQAQHAQHPQPEATPAAPRGWGNSTPPQKPAVPSSAAAASASAVAMQPEAHAGPSAQAETEQAPQQETEDSGPRLQQTDFPELPSSPAPPVPPQHRQRAQHAQQQQQQTGQRPSSQASAPGAPAAVPAAHAAPAQEPAGQAPKVTSWAARLALSTPAHAQAPVPARTANATAPSGRQGRPDSNTRHRGASPNVERKGGGERAQQAQQAPQAQSGPKDKPAPTSGQPNTTPDGQRASRGRPDAIPGRPSQPDVASQQARPQPSTQSSGVADAKPATQSAHSSGSAAVDASKALPAPEKPSVEVSTSAKEPAALPEMRSEAQQAQQTQRSEQDVEDEKAQAAEIAKKEQESADAVIAATLAADDSSKDASASSAAQASADGRQPSALSQPVMEAVRKLCSSLAADELDRLAVRVEPRGLTNTGNICFMNSILQALMAGSSFCYFMQTLKAAAPALDDPKLPTLRAFSALASELKTTPLAAEANGVLAAADSRPGSSKAGAAGKAPAKPAGSEKGVAEQTGFSALSQETPAGDETPEVTEASAASEPESETSAQPSQSASASGYKVSGQGSKREGPPPSNGGASSGAVAGTAWGVASGSSAAQQSGSTAQQLGGRELLPDMMFPIVSRFNPSNARPAPVSPPAKQTMAERMKQGRGGAVQREQEDAQEFLTHLLEKSHEELLELKARHMPHEAGQPAKPEQSEEWSEVQKGGSKKNRSAVTRGSEEVQGGMTLTSGIFGGSTRSVVKAASAPQPSITNQPFNVLHLEILHSDVASLADALSRHCAPETIEDYKWKDGVEGATATKTVTLLRLPQILVIHLMRFSYGLTGTGKVHKALRFDTTLRMQRAWVSDKCPMQGAEYELIATVSHHGRTPASGHYTADVRQPNDKWLRFDDANVYSVTVPKVLAEPVYLLFYQLKRPVRQ